MPFYECSGVSGVASFLLKIRKQKFCKNEVRAGRDGPFSSRHNPWHERIQGHGVALMEPMGFKAGLSKRVEEVQLQLEA